jgi:hypothetical protein
MSRFTEKFKKAGNSVAEYVSDTRTLKAGMAVLLSEAAWVGIGVATVAIAPKILGVTVVGAGLATTAAFAGAGAKIAITRMFMKNDQLITEVK